MASPQGSIADGRNNQTKNPCGNSQDSYFLLGVALDVHLMALRDGMIICGKSTAFYSQTACCLIDSSSRHYLSDGNAPLDTQKRMQIYYNNFIVSIECLIFENEHFQDGFDNIL